MTLEVLSQQPNAKYVDTGPERTGFERVTYLSWVEQA